MTQSVSVLDAELLYSRPLATPPMPVTINHPIPILILPLSHDMHYVLLLCRIHMRRYQLSLSSNII